MRAEFPTNTLCPVALLAMQRLSIHAARRSGLAASKRQRQVGFRELAFGA